MQRFTLHNFNQWLLAFYLLDSWPHYPTLTIFSSPFLTFPTVKWALLPHPKVGWWAYNLKKIFKITSIIHQVLSWPKVFPLLLPIPTMTLGTRLPHTLHFGDLHVPFIFFSMRHVHFLLPHDLLTRDLSCIGMI